jgi:hypothetical protein
MYSPEGRTGRRPGSAKLIVAAVSIALMGMAGAALAAPKADPGPPEQAQANGPPPQAQGNGPPPQAQDPPPAPPSARARANRQQGAGKPAAVPPVQPPQAGGESTSGSGAAQSRQGNAGHHGRPAPGEIRGRGRTRSNAAKANGCQAARCREVTAEPSAGAGGGGGGEEQPKPSPRKRRADEGDVVGVSEERPHHDHGGAAPDLGSVQGLNQGGGEEAYTARGSFDGALPFTGFEFALLAAIGAMLGLAGVRLRRSTA